MLHGGHQPLLGIATSDLSNLVISEPEYGSGKRAVPMNSPSDVKYIRITDFGDDGIPAGHEFVTAEEVEDKYFLEDDDILFARSGATVGKTFIYTKEIGPAIFAGYCIRFRFDPKKVIPWYVYFYTKTRRYAAWVRSIQRPAGQPNINKEEFKSFAIPVVSPTLQATLVKDLQSARNARDTKITKTEELLRSIDGLVLSELGLPKPTTVGRLAYALRLRELKAHCDDDATRFDPHYNASRFWNLLATLKGMPSEPLGAVVSFSDFQWNPELHSQETFNYIEISGVDVLTGEITATTTPISQAPSRARMLVHAGDILVSLTRPHRGAIGVVLNDLHEAVASTGFAVIRGITSKKYRPDYLLAILRSSVCLQQMLQRSSGGNYPAITESELKRIIVPCPDDSVQRRIVEEIANRKEQVRRVRAEATALWAKALEDFERKLLSNGTKGGSKA